MSESAWQQGSWEDKPLPGWFEFIPVDGPFGIALHRTTLLDSDLDEVTAWADRLDGEVVDELKAVKFSLSDPQTPETIKVLFSNVIAASSKGKPNTIARKLLDDAFIATVEYMKRKAFQQKRADVVQSA